MNYPLRGMSVQSMLFSRLRLWAISVVALLALAMTPGIAAQTPPPALFFADLDSGPNTGGETVGGFSGAYVTLYGNFFGASQGTSTVTWNGLTCLRVVPATGSYTGWGMPYLWYQKIVVQLGSSCAAGPGNFVITVNGQASNGIPFTVRAGKIFFVATTGNDANPCTFASKCATPGGAFSRMTAGDTMYVMGGVTSGGGGSGNIDFMAGNITGTAGNPIALVAYPGASPQPRFVPAGSYAMGLVCFSGANGMGNCTYGTIAGISLQGGVSSGWIRYGGDHWRVVGNDLSCPNGDGQTGCFATNQINNINFYGNYIHDNSTVSGNSSKQYHSVYFSTDSNHIDVGWNKWFNNKTCRALQFHSSPLNGGGPTDPTGRNQFDLHVHDNWMDGDRCNGINFATIDPSKGAVEAYNNVITNVGIGPASYDGESTAQAAIYMADITNLGTSGTGTVDIYNNTLYGNSTYVAFGCSAGQYENNSTALIMCLRNNITYSNTLVQYISGYVTTCNTPGAFSGTNNLWFGYSLAAPLQTTGNITSNPLFANAINKDFRLQSGSPAISAGVSTSAPTGIDGVRRGPAFDIGAYQFGVGSTVQRPNPPTNLSVTVQ